MSKVTDEMKDLMQRIEAVVETFPPALRSENPMRMLDYLATVFKEGDGQPVPGLTGAAEGGPSEEAPVQWGSYKEALRHQGTAPSPEAEAAAAAMHGSMAEVRQEIAEMDAASDLQGLDAASEVASSSGRMELVRCSQCSRVMLSEAVQGHLPQCKKVPLDSTTRISAKTRTSDRLQAPGSDWDAPSGLGTKRSRAALSDPTQDKGASKGAAQGGASGEGGASGSASGAPKAPKREIRGGLQPCLRVRHVAPLADGAKRALSGPSGTGKGASMVSTGVTASLMDGSGALMRSSNPLLGARARSVNILQAKLKPVSLMTT